MGLTKQHVFKSEIHVINMLLLYIIPPEDMKLYLNLYNKGLCYSRDLILLNGQIRSFKCNKT